MHPNLRQCSQQQHSIKQNGLQQQGSAVTKLGVILIGSAANLQLNLKRSSLQLSLAEQPPAALQKQRVHPCSGQGRLQQRCFTLSCLQEHS